MQRRSPLVAMAGACSVAGCAGLDPSTGAAGSAVDDGDASATGGIDVVVDGEPLDLSRERSRTDRVEGDSRTFFLRESADGWAMGDEVLTLAEALDAPARVSFRRDGWRVLAVGETTYDERNVGTELAFFVDGSLVDPTAYELEDGDSILIEIATDGAASYEEDPMFLDAKGKIDVVVDGEPLDLSKDRFQAEYAEEHARAFHLHEDSEQWYMEDFERVTFAGGLDLLPHVSYDRADGNHVLAVDDAEHDERTSGTELAFFVDGRLVTPDAYGLEDGNELRVEIATGS